MKPEEYRQLSERIVASDPADGESALQELGLSGLPSQEKIHRSLEERFLVPKDSFPSHLLPLFQTTWDTKLEIPSLLYHTFEPSPPPTTVSLVRTGLDGRVTGWEEKPNPRVETGLTSTSFQRAPAPTDSFVRGKSGYVPFWPGGLDDVILNPEIAASDQEQEKYLRKVAPGLSRGLRLPGEEDAADLFSALYSTDNTTNVLGQGEPSDADENDEDPPPTAGPSSEVDEFLPTSRATLQPVVAPRSTRPTKVVHKRDWAHVVDVNKPMKNFNQLVPDMAHKYPFELDTFQKEAVAHLEQGDSVFVAAHTSAGKTVVAEYAIALAEKHMTKAIYTSPIKALSNQKFRDFKQTFSSASVGILTGDVQINPEASCLIMTTEILRSMLYKGADLIRDVEFVIFDEVHYVNDAERGVVWEEVIIMLPDHVSIILLSATVGNTKEFADWVGRTKKKDIYVISTPKRPVPLEHFLYAGKEVYKIVDSKGDFLSIGYKDAGEALRRKQDKEREAAGLPPVQRVGARGAAPAQRGQQRGGQRGGQRGAPPTRGITRGGGPPRTIHSATDKNLYVHLLGNLRKKGPDRKLPQIGRMRDLLSRGIGVHHGGLLPIVKELVEILFSRGLVKMLFATETFAMGVNMPAKCVVFSTTRKHDGRSFRDLLPGEYTQMAGRAGRRGLDPTGTVIIVAGGELPELGTIRNMILGPPGKLSSQFRLTYNMILNLLRVEALRVEEMIKRSFSENASQRLLPDQQKDVIEGERKLATLPKLSCNVCKEDIAVYYDTCLDITECNQRLLCMAAKHPQASKSLLTTGRVVVLRDEHFASNNLAVILRPTSLSGPIENSQKAFFVLALADSETKSGKRDIKAQDVTPQWPLTLQLIEDPVYDVTVVALTSIAFVTGRTIKTEVESILDRHRIAPMRQALASLQEISDEWSNTKGLPEVEWVKMRSMEFQETLQHRDAQIKSLESKACVLCEDFLDHYAVIHVEKALRANIANLKLAISEQNLELIPDYEQRIAVLKELKFIDENSTVLLKGRVACEINSTSELVLTELILENTLAAYEPEEVVALLSSFVFQEKTDVEPVIPTKLQEGRDAVVAIRERVARVNDLHKVATEEFQNELKFGLMEVVYEWAKGMPFEQITALTDVPEGTIVRVITRLDETCREVRDAARVIGDAELFKKMEDAQIKIKRDIVFAASLYF